MPIIKSIVTRPGTPGAAGEDTVARAGVATNAAAIERVDPGTTGDPGDILTYTTAGVPITHAQPVIDASHPRWGIAWDGTTDDAPALQALANAMPIGAIIHFPPSPCRLASTVSWTNAPHLIGAGAYGQWDAVGIWGTRFLVDAGVTGFVMGNAGWDTYSGPKVEGMWFVGPGDDAGTIGIQWLRINNYQMNNVRAADFRGAGSIGIDIDGTGGYSQYGTLVEVHAHDCQTGLRAKEASGIELIGGYFDGNHNGTGTPNYHGRDIGSVGIHLRTGTEGFRAFGTRTQFWDTAFFFESGENHECWGTRNESNTLTFDVRALDVHIYGGSINNYLMGAHPTTPATDSTGVSIASSAERTMVRDMVQKVVTVDVVDLGEGSVIGHEGVVDTRSFTVRDDFIGGTPSSSGDVGELGWQKSGNVQGLSSTADHPGVCRIQTAASLDAIAYIGLWLSPIHTGATFDMTLVAAAFSTTAVKYRMGVMTGGAILTAPANGIYIEHLAADTNWFGVCRASGTETRIDLGVAVDTSFHRFRMRRWFSSIRFSVDGGDEYVITTNIPSASLTPEVGVHTTDTSTKLIDVDLVTMSATGLAR